MRVDPVVTPTLDVCSVLRKEARLEPSDHVVVKVDVEGADEMVLRRIQSGCHELVDTIAFEGSQKHPLKSAFRSLGIKVRPWA